MSKKNKSAAKAISESAHQIWLAGLGAFAKAQAEGSRVFEQLIREGAELEQRTRKYSKDSVGKMREQMVGAGERLRKRGQASVDRIQALIDDRVEQAVSRLSIPTQEDLSQLAKQLEELGRGYSRAAASAVQAAATTAATSSPVSASPKKAPARKPPAKKAAAKKAATKKSPTKKTAARKATAKKSPAKKTATKKSPAKKAAAKKAGKGTTRRRG